MSNLTREQIIDAIKRALGEDEYITESEFQRRSEIKRDNIYRLFPLGGWFEALTLAGVSPEKFPKKHITDDELLKEYHDIVKKHGKIPTWNLLATGFPYSVDLMRKRFGGLEGTLRRYCEWLEVNDPDSFILEQLTKRSTITAKDASESKEKEYSANSLIAKWPRVKGTEYGEPISFRGLRHAPINEQGVVFLFGMLARELGFEVEAIHDAYPDCEAKRLVDPQRKRWQRVRIEFEYMSHNFVDHGHDPSQCDLIVCWENNWPDCPIEVLALQSLISQFRE